ncbi:MAG: sensor histidine kinase [Candidatus Hodarchaeota archaeon]
MDLTFSILSNRLRWLINLRWVFCFSVIVIVWLSSSVFGVILHPRPLYVFVGIILLYNTLFLIYERYIACDRINLNKHILAQMILDQISLSLLLYFSGVPYNPFFFYYVFHIAIAALLLIGWAPYMLALLASCLAGIVMLLGYLEYTPRSAYSLDPGSYHSTVLGNGPHGIYLVGFFFAFTSTLWITVYFTSSVHKYLSRVQGIIRQKEKMLGISQLVAGIAHQISNPLDGIENCLQSIGRSVKDDTHLTQYVKLMTEALERIEQTTKSVQAFAGPHGLTLQDIDVNEAIEAVVQLLDHSISQKIQLVTELDKVPQVKGDLHILQEVIFNLCTNALSAMPDGGELCLRSFLVEADTFSQFKRVAIEVADTGCGIPESNIDKIFEPFFTTRKEAGGTGLGLALCRMLISEMDGQIEVSSVPNQETIFRLILNTTRHDFSYKEE